MPGKVLLVEDDETLRFGVARYLARRGFDVFEAGSCETARSRFGACDPDAVLTDFRLPDGEALELIESFRRHRPHLPILVLTAYGTVELAVRAVKTGAHDVFTKPIDLTKLVDALERACRASPRTSGVRPAVAPAFFKSAALTEFNDELERLKNVDCSLLILGETGTGKTVLARWLHQAGSRRDKPFVDLNCAGFSRDLLEAELFGHERGAFTSAHAAKPGMFELANEGTLFLDEIGDVDPAVQPKVLKAIEEKRFRRMGGVREQNVDVRIIAATHRDLREAARANAFRADLYYRLSTVTLRVPSLRERRADIPALASSLLESIAAKVGREPPELSGDALAALGAHDWPGNIRELKNVLERAVHLGRSRVLLARDLKIEEPVAEAAGAARTLRDVERAQIERAIAVHGHVGDAARSLGISRSSMYSKVKEYGLLPRRASSSSRIKVGS